MHGQKNIKVPAKLHKYVNAVLVIHFKTLRMFCCKYLKSLKMLKLL
jgi:hypothetical protein